MASELAKLKEKLRTAQVKNMRLKTEVTSSAAVLKRKIDEI